MSCSACVSSSPETLPEFVRRYLERCVPSTGRIPEQIRITQAGEMWRTPGARMMPFSATQCLAVGEVAFAWRARFPIAPLVSIDVVDQYARGAGTLDARVFGVPVMHRRGPEIVAGEAMRYLAELPWVPHAMAHNPELAWRRLNEWSVEVASRVNGESIGVQMQFGAAGDIVRVSSPGRPRQVGKEWVPTPWTGDFGEYALLGGIRIPTRAEVAWELAAGRFVYWRGTITSVELRDEPFERT